MDRIDFCIIFTEDNNKMEISVKSRFDNINLIYRVDSPNLSAEDIHSLRNGDASSDVIDRIQHEVSNWLLTPTIHKMLEDALEKSDEELFRFEFKVNSLSLYQRPEMFNFPVELLRLDSTAQPLVIDDKPTSIIHTISRKNTPTVQFGGQFPFRVLIVRANPSDGEQVPKVLDLRQYILDRGKEFPKGTIQVDVLTSEPGSIRDKSGVPTYDGLMEVLRDSEKKPYHLLVFIGHGYRYDSEMVLLFETDAGPEEAGQGVGKKELIDLLHDYPVPIVLLVGCYTATLNDTEYQRQPELESEERLEELESLVDRRVEGSLGIAQALISADIAVQFVIGMQYRLTENDALTFLRAFFHSLLVSSAGDVEMAVYRARRSLVSQDSRYSWSAPIVFRALNNTSVLSFLMGQQEQREPPKDLDTKRRILGTIDELLNVLVGEWRDAIPRLPGARLSERLEQQWIPAVDQNQGPIGIQIKLYRYSDNLSVGQVGMTAQLMSSICNRLKQLLDALEKARFQVHWMERRNHCRRIIRGCEILERNLGKASQSDDPLPLSYEQRMNMCKGMEDLRREVGELLKKLHLDYR